MPGGLDDSRWAPKNLNNRIHKSRGRFGQTARSQSSSYTTLSTSQSETLLQQFEDRPEPEKEFSRFLKIVARLNWKLPFLKMGYDMAKAVAGKDKSQVEASEVQFKLDFHEFYMLIERALVRLMGIFGVIVKGNGIIVDGIVTVNNRQEDGPGHDMNGDHKEHVIQHFYHKNVLAALNDTKNPLYSIFGKPEVRAQLSRAKDLRNRWKNIDEADTTNYAPLPLSTYNLELMMQTILTAIEEAHKLALEYLAKGGKEPEAKAEDWEFMVDAMDWEAV
ncbi:hypothetical protein F5B19DRAFT_478513 [Rostrohypoxylon terebratum]|nr:hypothetical protein F5B19DRAFT_478513 [Rostrohypoxylon terebratum]